MIDFVKEFTQDGVLAKDYKKVMTLKEKISLHQLKKDIMKYNLVMILINKMTHEVALTSLD